MLKFHGKYFIVNCILSSSWTFKFYFYNTNWNVYTKPEEVNNDHRTLKYKRGKCTNKLNVITTEENGSWQCWKDTAEAVIPALCFHLHWSAAYPLLWYYVWKLTISISTGVTFTLFTGKRDRSAALTLCCCVKSPPNGALLLNFTFWINVFWESNTFIYAVAYSFPSIWAQHKNTATFILSHSVASCENCRTSTAPHFSSCTSG